MHIVFVAPFLMEATLRFVRAAAKVPGVRLSLLSQDPVARVPRELGASLVAFRQVPDALDAGDIVAACVDLGRQVGPVTRLLGSLEQLQEPLALACEQLGLPGLGLDTARNFRDKARMKDVLRQHGLPCAAHQLALRAEQAREFARTCGFPLIVKPPAGAGAAGTHRLDDAATLERYLASSPPRPEAPALFEEFLSGVEHSFDSIMVEGKLVWWSVSRYLPSPLTVLENPWIQWCVLLPRELDGFADIRAAGESALAALGLVTGMTHMEWFRRQDGGLAISEVAARPPGAQFTSLLSYAHDADFYAAWANLACGQGFSAPPRRFAVGAAYVRGQGQGQVRAVHGLDEAERELGALVVEARLPRRGERQGSGYEGAGHVIVRHADTAVVEQALARIVRLVRVELG